MKSNRVRTTLFLLLLGGISMLVAAGVMHAQAPFQAEGQSMQAGPEVRSFGMPMMRPMMAGTVQSVDTTNGTITLTDPSGNTQTLTVSSDTKIVAAKTISASDLQVGDQIQVRGAPQVISADSIMSGDLGDVPPMGPVFGAAMVKSSGTVAARANPDAPGPVVVQSYGEQSDSSGAEADAEGNGPPPKPLFISAASSSPAGAMAIEQGTITSLSPLTVSLSDGQTVTVNTNSSTKVSTVSTESLSDIQQGDQVAAQINRQGDGTIRAVQVDVNLPMAFPNNAVFMSKVRIGGSSESDPSQADGQQVIVPDGAAP